MKRKGRRGGRRRGKRGGRVRPPGGEEDDPVFRALASPVRRAVLDLLRGGPRTTGEIAAVLPGTRFAAMKHLAVLGRAGLVVADRRGRERWNHVDPAPLLRVLRRWAGLYAALRAEALVSLERGRRRAARKGRRAGKPPAGGRKGRRR